MTEFYGWGPHDAWSLKWSEIAFWMRQAQRITEKNKRAGGR